MKIIIQNLSLDFSLESEHKLSSKHEDHSAYESELEGVIRKLSAIVDEKDKEIAELRAICDAPLPLEIQAYIEEITYLKTRLRDAQQQIEKLSSPVAEAPEATEAATSPTPVAEALEATAPLTKKQIICTCKVCGKTFPANHNRSQFCSEECRAASIKQKQSGKNVSASTTPVADALEATNKKTKTCTECAADFYPSSNRQMRCPACGIKKKSRKRNSELTRHPKK